jgi:hypothetical protein
LKTPKTEHQHPQVWLPKTVAYILREWKNSQEELKAFLGDDVYGLQSCIALPNGRLRNTECCKRILATLKKKPNFPMLCFTLAPAFHDL